MSCPSGPLEPGGSVDCVNGYLITQDDLDAGSITSTAHAIGTSGDGQEVTSRRGQPVHHRRRPGVGSGSFVRPRPGQCPVVGMAAYPIDHVAISQAEVPTFNSPGDRLHRHRRPPPCRHGEIRPHPAVARDWSDRDRGPPDPGVRRRGATVELPPKLIEPRGRGSPSRTQARRPRCRIGRVLPAPRCEMRYEDTGRRAAAPSAPRLRPAISVRARQRP